MTTIFEAVSEGLRKLVEISARFARGDEALRADQSANAPRPIFFLQGSTVAGEVHSILGEFSLTAGQAPITPRQAILSYAVFVTDDLSGRGRFRVDGIDPTPAGGGVPIRSGFGSFQVIGNENIWGLKWCAETGQVVNWTLQVFK